VYFKLANHYNIIDKPNERSSHIEPTIRGGGIIYLFAALVAGLMHPQYWVPVLAMGIIGTISFIDDRVTLSNKIRILFHLIAVTLVFFFLNLFVIFPVIFVVMAYILVIGIINAYNFMDGINGITGTYSLVVLSGLQYVNKYQVPFIDDDLIWLPILASLVFLIFNFRKRARCFAGDVGSITIALWIIFLLLTLILKTDNFGYILFLAVYGVDTVLTIIHRLILKQNIFDAHRLHFYQILANEQGMSHLLVAVIYSAIQLLIIAMLISSKFNIVLLFPLVILTLASIYILYKPRFMRTSGTQV
jgi:UDP-N-acetylmuramyl pentapeptide phosphotransferase/UDP-N-acetylglucosamine-1-phosphate transferase